MCQLLLSWCLGKMESAQNLRFLDTLSTHPKYQGEWGAGRGFSGQSVADVKVRMKFMNVT